MVPPSVHLPQSVHQPQLSDAAQDWHVINQEQAPVLPVPWIEEGTMGAMKEPPPVAEEEEEAVPTGQVMLDFVILPEQYGQTKAFDIQLTVGAIQLDLEKELQIPEGSLNLSNMTGVVQIEGPLDSSKCLIEPFHHAIVSSKMLMG